MECEHTLRIKGKTFVITTGALPVLRCSVPNYIQVFSYPPDGDALCETLRSHGMISPILAIGKDDGTWMVVCGAKRLYAARKSGWDMIPACILVKGIAEDAELFDIAFMDNCVTRRLNVIECAGVIAHAAEFEKTFSVRSLAEYLALLGVSAGFHNIEAFLRINALEDSIKKYLCRWEIPAGPASLLGLLLREDREDFFTTVEILQFHGGKFKRYIELVFEICRRENCSVRELLGAPAISEILNNSTFTQTQKQAKLLEKLHELRFPHLTQRSVQFTEIADSFDMPLQGLFSPPPDFEGGNIRISLQVKDICEIDLFCTAMQNEYNREKIQMLLHLL